MNTKSWIQRGRVFLYTPRQPVLWLGACQLLAWWYLQLLCKKNPPTLQDQTRNEKNVCWWGDVPAASPLPFIQLKLQVRITNYPKRMSSPPPPPSTFDLVSLTDVSGGNMMRRYFVWMLSKHSLLSFLWDFKGAWKSSSGYFLCGFV